MAKKTRRKINYENLKPGDLEDKEIKLKVSKKAFSRKLHCHKCKIKMKKTQIDMNIPEADITLHLDAYKCSKCGVERLSGDQAEKLDQLMTLIYAIKEKARFKFRRAMNFDGNSWFVRFPNELTHDWKKKIETDIVPLSSTDFLVHLHKG